VTDRSDRLTRAEWQRDAREIANALALPAAEPPAWTGSAASEVQHWRRRALDAEARLAAREGGR
jgi:hypothetical protein